MGVGLGRIVDKFGFIDPGRFLVNDRHIGKYNKEGEGWEKSENLPLFYLE